MIVNFSDEWRRISKELSNTGKSFIRVDQNLVDLVWKEYDQPPQPMSDLMALPLSLSGMQCDYDNDILVSFASFILCVPFHYVIFLLKFYCY